MISSNVAGLGSIGVSPAVMPEVIPITQTLPSKNKEIEIKKAMTVEEYVRNYFSDLPIMVEVAKCESRFRQHDLNGDTLRGVVNDLDRGVMQINEYYHNDDSAKFGYDILTLEGNTAYARHLFEKYGVKPWKSSMKCWSKTTAYADYQSLALEN